jgi:Bacterial TSP3 repeat
VDSDGDGLLDADEAAFGTDPGFADSDGDGWLDGDEVSIGTDPLDVGSFPVG